MLTAIGWITRVIGADIPVIAISGYSQAYPVCLAGVIRRACSQIVTGSGDDGVLAAIAWITSVIGALIPIVAINGCSQTGPI